jgi:hypothetical protein
MDDANQYVLEAVLDDVLDASILEDAVTAALQILTGDDSGQADQRRAIDQQILTVENERRRLSDAIAAGGDLQSLLDALKGREASLSRLRADRARLTASRPPYDAAKVRRDLEALASDWRHVLTSEPQHARPVLAQLLVGRVRFSPRDGAWEMSGQGTIAGLFQRVIGAGDPLGMASPTGFEPVFQP